MTAGPGTHPFSSPESIKSEEQLKEVIGEVLSLSEFRDFFLKSHYSVNELYGSTIATNKKKMYGSYDSPTEPDTGLLFYKDNVVGLGDNKFQFNRRNAVERCGIYLMDALMMGLTGKRVFTVLAGDGFVPYNEEGHVGSATSKCIVRYNHWFTNLVNPTVKETHDAYKQYLRNIMKEEK